MDKRQLRRFKRNRARVASRNAKELACIATFQKLMAQYIDNQLFTACAIPAYCFGAKGEQICVNFVEKKFEIAAMPYG